MKKNVAVEPVAADMGRLLLRLVVGGFLLPHGLGKLFGWFGGPGLAGFGAELQHVGLPSAAPLPLLLAAAQTLAGFCVAIGFLTRPAAVLAALFLATTVLLNLGNGWFWMARGIEYPLMWTLAALAVALLGAGKVSLDAIVASRRGRLRDAVL
ncbi:FIG00545367: hypothetical protein [plant metagenome]|uniref:DoxX family protein n=1 Tax=plant metagenome TaxID=1297885 RepID=A0A484U0X1_9ZZZZ